MRAHGLKRGHCLHCNAMGLVDGVERFLCQACRDEGHTGVPMDCDICLDRIFPPKGRGQGHEKGAAAAV